LILPGVSIGVEAETRPRDFQDLLRRIALKRRDGGVNRVVLLLRNSRWNRNIVRAHGRELSEAFPVDGVAALKALKEGRDLGGDAVIVI
jgi:hypothetical protein